MTQIPAAAAPRQTRIEDQTSARYGNEPGSMSYVDVQQGSLTSMKRCQAPSGPHPWTPLADLALTWGSIPGTTHLGQGALLAGRNNQDAVAVQRHEQGLVAVVCDGCGSGVHSEVGAHLGARLIARATLASMVIAEGAMGRAPASVHLGLDRVWSDVGHHLARVGDTLQEQRVDAVRDYLLFTVLAVVVAAEYTAVFGHGDGAWAVNGRFQRLGPYPGNAPPYMGYDLLDGSARPEGYRPGFVLHFLAPTATVDSVLIGSDGVCDLAERSQRCLPGRSQILGPVSQFWTEERFRRNPDAIRRTLALANSRATRLVHGRVVSEPGLLPDDTSLVVVRRWTTGERGTP